MASRRVFVLGVGMSKFSQPALRMQDSKSYPEMVAESARAALADANLPYQRVEAAVASYCYGEPTSGQRAIYELGLTGIPIFNVNNNCSSGSSALMLARSLVQSGQYRCVMATGFEQMERGLSERYPDKVSPVARHFGHMAKLGADEKLLPGMNQMTSEVIKLFAYAAREYMHDYPSCSKKDFAFIAAKNRRHGAQNPNASFFGKPLPTVEQALEKTVCEPITAAMCSYAANGSATAIVCSEEFLREYARARAVEILAQHMVTDLESSFARTYRDLSGYAMGKAAAEKCYNETNLRPSDVDVIELHDCFSPSELFLYEALGLAAEGQATRLLRSGQWTKNSNGGEVYKMGRWVVNPSGGLEAKGHPIGASGLGQCFELVTQLRNEAGKRQVDGARIALQHNFGIGGAAVVTLYRSVNGVASRL